MCAWQYLPHYGSCVNGRDAIILCELDPVNIVAIPIDYNNSKLRCTTYTPLSEYTYDQGEIDKVLYRGYNTPSLGDYDGDGDLEDEDYSYEDSDDDDYYLEDED